MIEIVSFLCILAALAVLAALSAIDIRHYILPNKLVAVFAVLGVAFHAVHHFTFNTPLQMLLGALLGGGILYLIRAVANYIAKDDTLGLGDVKLLAAAGLWLGDSHVLLAMTIGAFAGILHGVLASIIEKLKTGKFGNLKTMSVPAGPGFAIGIVLAGIYKFVEIWP